MKTVWGVKKESKLRIIYILYKLELKLSLVCDKIERWWTYLIEVFPCVIYIRYFRYSMIRVLKCSVIFDNTPKLVGIFIRNITATVWVRRLGAEKSRSI